MVVPDNVLGLILAKNWQHYTHLLPVFLLWPPNWFLQHVLHSVLEDRIKLVDGKEWATLIVELVFLKVIIENLLIYLLLGRVSSCIGLDKGLLHEICVE